MIYLIFTDQQANVTHKTNYMKEEQQILSGSNLCNLEICHCDFYESHAEQVRAE
jgi:hypothetical protein